MNYEWKEPPTDIKGVRLITPEILELLKSRPSQWLFIGRQNRSAWQRSASSHPSRQIECTTRDGKGLVADIYLRWVA